MVYVETRLKKMPCLRFDVLLVRLAAVPEFQLIPNAFGE